MQKHTALKLIILLLICIHITSFSQEYFFKTYGVQDGLARTVYSIVQDEDNYIWLGTGNGLFKFDGHTFQMFSSEDYALASNQVKTLFIHSNGDIWMGHWNGGITRFNGKQFQTIRAITNNKNEDIIDIEEDINGELWLATVSNGVYYIANPQEEQPEIVNFKGGKLGSYISDITLLSDSTLLFNTELYVSEYIRSTKSFERVEFKGTNYGHKYCLLEDQQGFLWIGTHNDGLFKYNRRNNDFAHFDEVDDGLETNTILKLYQDSKGYIWTINYDDRSIKGGVTRILGSSVTAFNANNGLPGNKIQCVFEDNEGNILLGITENGLSIFKGTQFEIYNTEDAINNKPGLINNQVYAIYEDVTGNIWFGTDGGISIFQAKQKNFTHYNYTNSKINNKVRFITGNQTNIWVGTEGGGLFLFNTNTKKFRQVYLEGLGWAKDNIITSLELVDNILWIGTNSGLLKYNTKNLTGPRLNDVENGLCGNTIRSIWHDGDRLWIGAVNSGVAYSSDGVNFTCLPILNDVTPFCFIKDDNDQLWVGTNQGVYIIVNDTTIVKHLTKKDGLLSNNISFLNTTPKGDLFIGTILGVHKYSIARETLYAYNDYNGFPGIEAKPNASYLDSKGQLWMGSAKGVVKYSSRLDNPKITKPFTTISEVQVNLEKEDFYNGIKLNYFENKIYFHYTSVNTTNPKSVTYQVMLEGLDKDWQPATSERVSKYEALSPGKYAFKVKAKNSYGIWNDTPVEINFTIKPPFYRTWWFILSAIFLGATIIISYIKIRERNLVKEKKVLEQRVMERTFELSDANAELAMKNKDITDSIQYAKRIQFSILPPKIPFENTFVLFNPKDIVSGDFYWINSLNNKEFIAAVDCTGHGVPGAFMSFIGYTSLNKIILEQGVQKPSLILNKLDEEVVNALHQDSDDEVKDGMDISLIKWDPETRKLEYAGAYNAMFIIRNGELIEYKANRFAIGRSLTKEKNFTNHEIDIEPGDMVYMFSDGYADQFGGPNGKKFLSKKFKHLLTSIADKPINEQHNMLEKNMEDWRGDIEQIDDILVIGRKF